MKLLTGSLLLDTHVLVWLLDDSARITEQIYGEIQQAADEDQLFVSAITPLEIALLAAMGKLRLSRDVAEWINAALSLPGIRLEPLSPAISVASTRLPWEAHGDPADRILLATARHLNATLVTADQQMLDYGFVKCISPS
jgi:PIN domain nuclease of toxin-antitoxin system